METVEYMQEMENLRRRAEHRRINADMKRNGTYPLPANGCALKTIHPLLSSKAFSPRPMLVFFRSGR